MNKDHIEGTARQVVGSLKAATGRLLDDLALELSGREDQAAGALQKAIGDVKDLARDSVHPPRK